MGMELNHNTKQLLCWYVITLRLRQTLQSWMNHQEKPVIVPTGERRHEPIKKPSGWVIHIKEKLRQNRASCSHEKYNSSKKCIYKIPVYLQRSKDREAYEPEVVSLGPYHNDNPNLKETEQHKWRCLRHILKRSKKDVTVYFNAIKELEPMIRERYEEGDNIKLSPDELSEMMVLDGCFILELFQANVHGFLSLGYSIYDPLRVIMNSIQHDMLKLENQIPFFVLERLLQLQHDTTTATTTMYDHEKRETVASLAAQFFEYLMPNGKPIRNDYLDELRNDRFDPLLITRLHCLDMFHEILLASADMGDDKSPKMLNKWYSSVSSMIKTWRKNMLHHVVHLTGENPAIFKILGRSDEAVHEEQHPLTKIRFFATFHLPT